MKKLLVEIPADAPFTAEQLRDAWMEDRSCVEAGEFVLENTNSRSDFDGSELFQAFIVSMVANAAYEGVKLLVSRYRWRVTRSDRDGEEVLTLSPPEED